jgi:hypothetical protein
VTATTMTKADARGRRHEPMEGAAGAGFRLLPGRTVMYSWLLAAVPIALLQLVHSDLHEHNELPPVLHWVRDTSLAVPFAAIAVIAAALLVARLRPTEPGERAALTTMAMWGVLAALLFAVLSIPGNQLHGFLFGAEEEVGVSVVEDVTTDAVYSLEAALLALAPLVLLVGVPWRGAWRAAAVTTPGSVPGAQPTGAASDEPFETPAIAETTNAGGDR